MGRSAISEAGRVESSSGGPSAAISACASDGTEAAEGSEPTEGAETPRGGIGGTMRVGVGTTTDARAPRLIWVTFPSFPGLEMRIATFALIC